MTMTGQGQVHLDVYKNKELISSAVMESCNAVDYVIDFNQLLLGKGFQCSAYENESSRVMAYKKGSESLNLIIKRK